MQIFRGIFLYEPNLHQRTLAHTTLREKEREKEKEKERERLQKCFCKTYH